MTSYYSRTPFRKCSFRDYSFTVADILDKSRVPRLAWFFALPVISESHALIYSWGYCSFGRVGRRNT